MFAIVQTEGARLGMGKHVFSSNKFPVLRNREIEGKQLLWIMPFKLFVVLKLVFCMRMSDFVTGIILQFFS
jgi:hypothetical protein